jgi:hypothetical protein
LPVRGILVALEVGEAVLVERRLERRVRRRRGGRVGKRLGLETRPRLFGFRRRRGALG